jgi:antitoxin PrlF
MTTTLTSKGQVTIPKQIRDALNMMPGCAVQFAVNRDGDVVIHKWRTDELMALLRGED